MTDAEQGYAQAYREGFAGVYNDHWSAFATRMAPKIVELFESRSGSADGGKTALDLCCGTGQLAQELVKNGYHVTGIDLSEPMLRYARMNNAEAIADGRAEFSRQDASSFVVDRAVSRAVSLFDALNHLPDEDALRGCFTSVYAALGSPGIFVFDLNTPIGFHRWNAITVQDGDEVTIINRGVYADGADRAFTSVTGFVRREDGSYDRFREVVYETVFDMDRVKSLLSEAGFVDTYVASSDDLTVAADDASSLGRAFFVCGKE